MNTGRSSIHVIERALILDAFEKRWCHIPRESRCDFRITLHPSREKGWNKRYPTFPPSYRIRAEVVVGVI